MFSFARATARAAVLAALLAAAAVPPPPASPALTGYADLAELTLAAPVIVRATVTRTDRLTADEAPGLPAGRARLLVTAEVVALLRAPAATPAVLRWLWETPLDARGRVPRLKRDTVLVFAKPVPGRADQLRLLSSRAQLAALGQTEATVRAILAEATAAPPPVITGIASAFHVPGAIAGEAESQFFLATPSGAPVSLVVLRRPGEVRQLKLALGDVIDDAATEVRPATLLWFRLACSLPAELPASIADERAALAADYTFVRQSLGPCGRTGQNEAS